jgi:hypothetical protein
MTTTSAHAASTPDIVVPGCPGFDVGITISGNSHRVTREFLDSAGNTVRIIDAGKGNDLTFINQNTGTTVVTKANGAVSQTVINPDGTSKVTSEGHNVFILFPGEPGGPATTLHVGRVVYTVDAAGVFTFISTSGRSRDICAELTP